MLGNFTYSNPTKLYFGENSIDNLKTELAGCGKNVFEDGGSDAICFSDIPSATE